MTLLLLSANDDVAGAILPSCMALLGQRKRGDSSHRRLVIELYDEVRPALFGYLSSMGLKAPEAEDVIQETFLRLFHHLVGGGSIQEVRGWTFRVAHNLCLNLHRADRRLVSESTPEAEQLLKQRLDPALNPEESLSKKEQLGRVALATSHLTLRQQQCLHLRAEGLRYREIAVALGVSTQRVSDLIQRALASLAGEV
jgi:RNA polymerase sigma-70 factor (ECF subfamily)